MNECRTGRFVVQRHEARTLHHDFRLEISGVFKSWAVPKGPPVQVGERRLAVMTADHDLSFGSFAGVIPPDEYGAGTITIWDQGTFTSDQDPAVCIAAGALVLTLHGAKLRGRFELVKLRRGRWRAHPESRDWLITCKSTAI